MAGDIIKGTLVTLGMATVLGLGLYRASTMNNHDSIDDLARDAEVTTVSEKAYDNPLDCIISFDPYGLKSRYGADEDLFSDYEVTLNKVSGYFLSGNNGPIVPDKGSKIGSDVLSHNYSFLDTITEELECLSDKEREILSSMKEVNKAYSDFLKDNFADKKDYLVETIIDHAKLIGLKDTLQMRSDLKAYVKSPQTVDME